MNIEYDNQLNIRLQQRNIPDSQLRPLFDFRPTPTKYTLFHTVEDNAKSNEPLFTYNPYSPSTNFNPSQKGTTDFYLRSIDDESKLQNRFMALQKADQAVYIPELSSSLYECPMAFQKNSYYYDNVNYQSRKPKINTNQTHFFNHTKTKNQSMK